MVDLSGHDTPREYVEESCDTCNVGGCEPYNHVCYGCFVYQKYISEVEGRPIPTWAKSNWEPAEWFVEMQKLQKEIKKKDAIIEMHEQIGEKVFQEKMKHVRAVAFMLVSACVASEHVK